jgi:hypothetical protein
MPVIGREGRATQLVHTGPNCGGGLLAPPVASAPVSLTAGEPVDGRNDPRPHTDSDRQVPAVVCVVAEKGDQPFPDRRQERDVRDVREIGYQGERERLRVGRGGDSGLMRAGGCDRPGDDDRRRASGSRGRPGLRLARSGPAKDGSGTDATGTDSQRTKQAAPAGTRIHVKQLPVEKGVCPAHPNRTHPRMTTLRSAA